ncbi:S-adenosyl-L-methionine-dependent methyltransferase [Mollisia scopiformis]|uniref:S-adenosyl-L-methionine-dependent methyltransferase n=1 Tax=Mollisia scopiformis TaxID=149040 RepID=A0A194X2B3_MOLSC|nr:S-adenosyl-L-methionine-dependent methyltransferase [Mollisia scopiformis]KUJ14139.1 S-adenosyl-L-methionine-dependent methyltransferase [Mollisia scopiformis]
MTTERVPSNSVQSNVGDEDIDARYDGFHHGAIADLRSEVASIQTLDPDFCVFIEENGRTYHAYKPGCLLLAQFPGVGRILDVGTGTGIWAIEFARQYPAAQVIGVDLSPMQPQRQFLPTNVQFQVADLEDPWTFPNRFDVVHCRSVFPCLNDPAGLIKQAHDALLPGGIFEMQDMSFRFNYDEGGTYAFGTALADWAGMLRFTARRAGKDWTCAERYKQDMQNAGFQDVQETVYRWPINGWPTDAAERRRGRISQENLLSALESLSYAPMTRYLNMSKEEVDAILIDVEKEINDTKIPAYLPIYVVHGRKPCSDPGVGGV